MNFVTDLTCVTSTNIHKNKVICNLQYNFQMNNKTKYAIMIMGTMLILSLTYNKGYESGREDGFNVGKKYGYEIYKNKFKKKETSNALKELYSKR